MLVLGGNPIDSEKRKERTKEKRHRGIFMLDISLHGIYTMTDTLIVLLTLGQTQTAKKPYR
jgi:hypothetical protein